MQTGSDFPGEPDLDLARDLVQAGQIDEAEQAYLRAIEARPAGEQRAALLSELAEALQRFAHEQDAIRYLKQALEEHRDPNSTLSETLENQLAICLMLTDRAAEARGRMKLAPWLAEAVGSPRLLARAFLMRAQLLGHRLELKAAAREYERAAQFALEARAWDIATRALHRAATQHLQLGNLRKGLQFSGKALHAAKRWRDLATLVEIHSVRALIFQMQGNWPSTHEELVEGLRVLEHLGQPPAEAFYLITVDWYLRLWQGNIRLLDQLEYEIRKAEFPHPPTNEPARWIALVKANVYQDRMEDARGVLRDALMWIPPAPPEVGPIDSWLVAAFNLADCICDAGDAAAGLARYEHLAQYAHLLVPHTLPTLVLGRIASLNRMWEEAEQWLAKAHSLSVRAGMQPFEALVNYEFGLLYERRGDRPQAQAHFRRAALQFEKLGMRWYREQALRQIKNLVATGANGALTRREKEVILLWLKDMTAAAIAKALVVSLANVNTHRRNAYKKMGVHDRIQARAWAVEHGLISIHGQDGSTAM